MLRSRTVNYLLSGDFQYKWLQNKQESTGSDLKKNSDVLSLALQFDRCDNLFGGGLSFGSPSAMTFDHHGLASIGF